MAFIIRQRLLACGAPLLRSSSLRTVPISHACPATIPAKPASQSGFATLVQRPKEYYHLTNVKDNNGARRKRKILGRGEGGKGKTSGRGMKGYHARQHKATPLPGFEGGQTGLIKAIPKLGKRGIPKLRFTRLYLDTLQHFVETGKLDASKTITIKELAESKCVGKIKDGVVLLAKGGEFFNSKVDIEVTRASQVAMKLIEEKGGNVKCVYHGKEVLRSLLRPDRWAIMPKNPLPTTKENIARYTNESRRGYLAPLVEGVDKSEIVKKLLERSRPQATTESA
ncbi:hypothetical protein SpCBS45565_g07807 [Spizellomyces sp. 'palustris']|nr:hypothetical protein SpCBS45565_g07807 [Spizellomyces sp. 'palustris']